MLLEVDECLAHFAHVAQFLFSVVNAVVLGHNHAAQLAVIQFVHAASDIFVQHEADELSLCCYLYGAI